MEDIGKRTERRQGELIPPDKLERGASPDDAMSESRAGLGARFSEIRGRIAAALLSTGIPAFEMPPAHAIEPVPTEISEKIVNETLSSPVVEEIRGQGFDVRVTLPLPENTSHPSYYFVHVEQLHEATFPGLDRLRTLRMVDEYHKRLYPVYKSLVTACKSPIFREGWACEELFDQKEAEKINKEVSDAIGILTNAPLQSIEDVLTLLTKVEEYHARLPNFRRHPQAQALADALQAAEGRISVFAEFLPPDDKKDSRLVVIKDRLRILFGRFRLNSLDGYVPQFNASSRLFYEGEAELFPAEDAMANDNAIALLKEADTARERIEALIQEAETLFESTPEGKEIDAVYREARADSDLTAAEIA